MNNYLITLIAVTLLTVGVVFAGHGTTELTRKIENPNGSITYEAYEVAGDPSDWAGVVPEYVHGYRMSYTTSNTVTLTVGAAASSDYHTYLKTTNSLVPDLTVSGDNGLDTGTEASNTWYCVYVAETNGTVVSVFSTSMVAPVGYTDYRRVGMVRNDENKNILMFLQRGRGATRHYYWNVPVTDTRVLLNGSSTTYADVDLSSFVPPESDKAVLQLAFESTASGAASDSLRVKAADTDNAIVRLSAGVLNDEKIYENVDAATDSSQKVAYKVDNSSNNATITVKGFYDDL